jgi:hypothetical protein
MTVCATISAFRNVSRVFLSGTGASTRNTEAVVFSEKSVFICQTTRRLVSDDAHRISLIHPVVTGT